MTKNFVTFILVSVTILLGWSLLSRQFFPPKADDKKGQIAQKVDTKKDDAKKEKKVDEEPKDKEKDKEKVKAPEEKKIEKNADPIPEPAEVKSYELGDKGSFLSVVVTNRGAGVQKLTLTKFEAADYLGQPAHRPLDFIQDDPFISSFRMYHYKDATVDRPTIGMGEIKWNPVGDGVEKDGDGWKIAFWTEVPDQRHLKVTKTYRLQPTDYHVGLSIEIHNEKGEKTPFRYQLTGSHGLPLEGEWYTPATSLRNAVVGVVDDRDNLLRTIEDSGRISAKKEGEKVPAGNSWMQYAGVMTQYFASVLVVDHKQSGIDWKKSPSILQLARASQESTEVKSTLLAVDDDTVTFRDGDEVVTGKLLPRAKEHLKVLGLRKGSRCVVNFARDAQTKEAFVQWFRLGQVPHGFFDDITVRVNSDTIVLAPGGKVTHSFLLYHGPVKTKLLGQMRGDDAVSPSLVDKYTHQLHLNTLTDYPSDSIFGTISSKIGWSFLLIASTNLMHTLLFYLHFVSFGSWGFSILLLTMVVRGAMFPISRKQALMTQKMQALAPEIKKLQEKYKDDKAAQGQATMELYRKHKVSPAGGCLPLLLQMPIFMGLYYCLQESVQFRLAKFFWIDNLAAPDMLFWWGQSIPWINDPDSLGGFFYLGPFFNLLPIIAVGFMIMQQKLMTPPAQNEEQEMQQKMMRYMMGFMCIMFYKVAAGLCLYFIASSLWGLIERKLLPKKTLAAAVATGDTAVTAKPEFNNRRKEKREKREREAKEPETAMERLKAWWVKLLESAEKK